MSQSTDLKYPFIQDTLNVISNDSIGLNAFFQKLKKLKTGERKSVTIVHIGDSHILADQFSGEIREALQNEYGNAGRGLIFPYKLAESNGPNDYRSSSNIKWDNRKVINSKKTYNIGISGMTIKTKIDTADFGIKVKDTITYAFNKVTLFHDKSDSAYDYMLFDGSERNIGFIKSRVTDKRPYTSTVVFDTLVKQVVFKAVRYDTTQCYAQIYGLLLENGKQGIIYNTIGVNGARYYHFNLSRSFFEQLAYLRPDLIIVSMGANEAFGKPFNMASINKTIDYFITTSQKVCPQAKFIITTPSDSYKKRKKNANAGVVRTLLVKYCKQKNIAYWDLYNVMGGFGSMSKWNKAKLSQPDRLHFNKAGYQLQAELFLKALTKSYKKFEHRL